MMIMTTVIMPGGTFDERPEEEAVAFGVFMMAGTNLILCVGPAYVIFCSPSYVLFLAQFLPHAVIGKLAWYTNIPWVRTQMARLACWGGAVTPEGPVVGGSLAIRLKAAQIIAREQVRCGRAGGNDVRGLTDVSVVRARSSHSRSERCCHARASVRSCSQAPPSPR